MLNYIASAIEKSKTRVNFDIEISEPSMIVTTDTPPEIPNFDPLEKLTECRHYNLEKVKSQIVSFLITYDPLSTKNPEKSTVMPLSQKSKSLTRIFGSHSGANRALKMLKNIGLLSIASTKYRYNSNNNIAMTYRYNHFVAEILKNALKDVEPYIHPKRKWKKVCDAKLEKYNPKVGSNRIPLDKFDLSLYELNAAINYSLSESCPIIEAAKDVIEKVNKFYQGSPEFFTHFELSIHSTKYYITKIGLRATSQFCGSSDHPNFDTFNGLIRGDTLKKYGLKYKNDINGSVPRITLSILMGRWVTRDEFDDVYKQILVETQSATISAATTEADPKRKSILEKFAVSVMLDDRDDVKSLFMRAYFCPSLKYMIDKLKKSRKPNSGVTGAEIEICASILYKAVRNIIGESLGSEIFVYESAIMNNIALKLLEKGNFCALVYDCIYTTEKISDAEFDELLKESYDEMSGYINKSKNLHPILRGARPLNTVNASKNAAKATFSPAFNGIINGFNIMNKKISNREQYQSQYNILPLVTKLSSMTNSFEYFEKSSKFLRENTLKYPKLE